MAQNNDRKRDFDGEPSEQHPNKVRRPDEVGVKFLLPNVVVGALLSRKAEALKRIRDQTCHGQELLLKLSGKEQFYPGTANERMVALVGSPPMIHRACCLLQDQIIDDPFLVTDESGTNEKGPRQGQMKIAVTDRAASKIIGSRGAVVKDISAHFNIAISITPAKEIVVPDERVVTILGPSRNIFDALEPIIYQISLQQAHIEPEFDYYDQYNKPKEEDVTKEENKGTATVKEESVVIEVQVKEEPGEETSPNCGDKNAEEPLDEDPKDKNKEKSEKRETTEEIIKKLLKDPRADGRWVWQNDRSNQPSWVWIENQKNGPHSMNNRGRGWGRRWH